MTIRQRHEPLHVPLTPEEWDLIHLLLRQREREWEDYFRDAIFAGKPPTEEQWRRHQFYAIARLINRRDLEVDFEPVPETWAEWVHAEDTRRGRPRRPQVLDA